MTTPAPETIEKEQGKLYLSDAELIRRLTLKQAAELFFGDARHASTLRVEIERGNLVASKIGRAYWTTLPALKDMEIKWMI